MSVQFGKRCKILRQERGLTQQQVADALGISRSAYAYYMSNLSPNPFRRTQPSLSVLWELAQYFQVSADSLLDTSIK